MKLVIFGLTISSSWGNGHATLWRGLCRALDRLGHQVVFFEHDVAYYARHLDLSQPPGCDLHLYRDWATILPGARSELTDADVAMVTSYCPDGAPASDLVLSSAGLLSTFYLHRDFSGQSDIVEYYSGQFGTAHICYVVQPEAPGLCDSIFRALIHPDEPVVVGLPDTAWFPADGLARLRSDDLSLLLVLDVGCNGGFYAIEMKRRGADRVVALDVEIEQLTRVADDYPFTEKEVFDRPKSLKMYFIEGRYSGDPTNWWIPDRVCAEAMLRSAGFQIIARPEEEAFFWESREQAPQSSPAPASSGAWR